ncbi:MAG: hypothetical protein ABFD51_09455, partial [Anaerolineaceae bacterium]
LCDFYPRSKRTGYYGTARTSTTFKNKEPCTPKNRAKQLAVGYSLRESKKNLLKNQKNTKNRLTMHLKNAIV